MNKHLLALLLVPFIGFSQFKTNDEGNLEFEKVIEADSLSSKQLHDKTAEWAALTFNDSNKVTKLDREDKIIINALSILSLNVSGIPIDGKLEYSLVISFKQGRYKIDFTNIITKTGQVGSETPTPAIAYELMTFQIYKNMVLNQTEKLDERRKKVALQMFSKEGYLEDLYENSKVFLKDTDTQIKTKILNLSNSLENYINDSNANENDDDW